MSSSQSPVPEPPKAAPSSQPQPQNQAGNLPESEPSAGITMDQHLASTLTMDSSANSTISDVTLLNEPETSGSTLQTDVDARSNEASSVKNRQHPIPPASEPMQYRAIGLVRGIYAPSEEQFTRGTLTMEDGTSIGAVLLGRVMSLVKKHLDLADHHLWVVYPRTRNKENTLHLQIVGVWEPEKLNRPLSADSSLEDTETHSEIDTDDVAIDSSATASEASTAETADSTTADSASDTAPEDSSETATDAADAAESSTETAAADAPADSDGDRSLLDLEDGYFSIRGEVIFHIPEEDRLVVKIQQAPRKGETGGKAFQLNMQGTLEGKAVGYFWDLQVQRQHDYLLVKEGTMIALVPPKKRKAGESDNRRPWSGKPKFGGGGGGGGGARRRSNFPREGQSAHASGDRPTRPPSPRRAPAEKPIKRPKDGSSTPNPE